MFDSDLFSKVDTSKLSRYVLQIFVYILKKEVFKHGQIQNKVSDFMLRGDLIVTWSDKKKKMKYRQIFCFEIDFFMINNQ